MATVTPKAASITENGQADLNKDPQGTADLALLFCSQTSAHGLANIPRTHKLVGRLVWSLLVVTAMGSILYQLSGVVSKYYSYPSQEVTYLTKEYTHFPDVTVCNIEPLAPKRLRNMLNGTSVAEYDVTKLPMIRRLRTSFPNNDQLNPSRTESSRSYYENMTPDDRTTIGHTLQDLVIRCTFSNRQCGSDSFRSWADGTYYNCYTFSVNDSSENTSGFGPDDGLSMVLFLDSTNGTDFEGTYDVASNVKQSAGARVVVHNRGSMPSPLMEGIDILPGHSTSLALAGTLTQRLSEPYGNCTAVEVLTGKPVYTYSTEGCIELESQKYIYDACNCISVNLAVPDELSDKYFCGFYDYDPDDYMQRLQCERKAWVELNNFSYSNSSCAAPCRSFDYDVSLAQSVWPYKRYQDDFYEKVVEDHPFRESLSAYTNIHFLRSGGTFRNTTAITDNFLRLNVYFKTEKVLVREAVPSYELPSLLSDMGGTIGLWAGLSVITIIEGIWFLAMLITRIANGI